MSTNALMDIFQKLESFTDYLSAAAPFIFFFVGCGLILMDRYYAFQLSRRKNLSVEAKITKLEVSERLSNHGHDGSTMMYRPVIEYDYAVNGVLYQSDRIAFSSRAFASNNKESMESLSQQYSVGKTVTVFVNSDNHQDAYLIETSPNERALLVMGCVFILCSLVIYTIFAS